MTPIDLFTPLGAIGGCDVAPRETRPAREGKPRPRLDRSSAAAIGAGTKPVRNAEAETR